jgi:hypothetical protein
MFVRDEQRGQIAVDFSPKNLLPLKANPAKKLYQYNRHYQIFAVIKQLLTVGTYLDISQLSKLPIF